MIEIFGKPFSEIGLKDIERLIDSEVSEDYYIEFKSALSTKSNEVDKWVKNQSGIGKQARKKIAKEITAFANAEGGILILGMEETDTNPPKAKRFKPLPKPHDLAKRLSDQLADTIEPKIYDLKTKGIETSEGEGIVIIKVNKSLLAPHRSRSNLECYIRREESSEPMTMREIKNLTLERYHEFDRLNNKFNERAVIFKERLNEGRISFNQKIRENYLSVRFSYYPITTEINFDKLDSNLNPVKETLKVRLNGKQQELQLPFFTGRYRPILRGSKYYGDELHIEVHESGLVEYYLLLNPNKALNSDWLVALNYKGLCFIDELLNIHNLPEIKFGYEIEIRTNKEGFKVYLPDFYSVKEQTILSSQVLFPRYAYDKKESKPSVVNLVYKDFANYSGFSNTSDYEIIN